MRVRAFRAQSAFSFPPSAVRLFRLVKIISVSLKYGLDQMILSNEPSGRLAWLARLTLFRRTFDESAGARLRQALESLGPIFVKFGQMLSTRRDLLPPAIAEELARLQDRVPPFGSAEALAQLEEAYGKPADAVFARFDREPVASASIAQVHFAQLPDGTEVAVKILRPGIAPVIAHDLALLDVAATVLEKLWPEGRRLKPREVVAEFDTYLHDELDLVREAANAAQLRRNMADLPLIIVPEMHWDLCSPEVIVMERMKGLPISQVDRLREAGVQQAELLPQVGGLGGIVRHQRHPVFGLGHHFQPTAGHLRRGHVLAHAQRLTSFVRKTPRGERQCEHGDFHTARVQLQAMQVVAQHCIHRLTGGEVFRGHPHRHQHQEGRHEEVARAAAGVKQLELVQAVGPAFKLASGWRAILQRAQVGQWHRTALARVAGHPPGAERVVEQEVHHVGLGEELGDGG